MRGMLPQGWLWDPFDMPSGTGTRSRQADKLWKHSQQEHAGYVRERWCGHCGRLLHADETTYCRLCHVDISEESED